MAPNIPSISKVRTGDGNLVVDRKATDFASESASAWREILGFIEIHAQH